MSLDTNALGQLVELSRDAAVGVENDAVVFANPAAQALLSLRVGDPAGKYFPEYILSDPSERFVSTMKRGARTLDVTVTRSGPLTLLYLVRREKDTGGPSYARALAELGSDLFSARLAIDAIVGGTHAEEDEVLGGYASVLYRSYYRMKRLHDHMILAGRIHRDDIVFTPRMISLRDLCRALFDTVEPLVRPLGLRLSFRSDDDPCRVVADATLLETMLLNVLANSLQRTESGGGVALSLTRHGGRYILAVDDEGGGIRPERMPDLLTGAQTIDMTDAAAGAGLGLMIASGIAEKHGGALIMESRERQGTRLRIVLPCPRSQDADRLYQPEAAYRTDGMDMVLTELSVVLDKSVYTRKMFD